MALLTSLAQHRFSPLFSLVGRNPIKPACARDRCAFEMSFRDSAATDPPSALFESVIPLRCSLSGNTSPPATTARTEVSGIVLFQHLSGTAHSVSWTF